MGVGEGKNFTPSLTRVHRVPHHTTIPNHSGYRPVWKVQIPDLVVMRSISTVPQCDAHDAVQITVHCVG